MMASGYLRSVVVKFEQGTRVTDASGNNDQFYVRPVVEHQFASTTNMTRETLHIRHTGMMNANWEFNEDIRAAHTSVVEGRIGFREKGLFL